VLINKKTKLIFICLVFFFFLLIWKMISYVTLLRETIRTVSFLIRCGPNNYRKFLNVYDLNLTVEGTDRWSRLRLPLSVCTVPPLKLKYVISIYASVTQTGCNVTQYVIATSTGRFNRRYSQEFCIPLWSQNNSFTNGCTVRLALHSGWILAVS